jgi:hypothetical protein
MDDLDEKVLDITQRQKRAMILRRYHSKIERARELAQKRLAPEKNIKKRAYAQARQIVRKRFAGQRGAEYEKLGPSEKIAVDRAIEKKTALIKKLALRLIPRVKQAEAKRLQSFVRGHSPTNTGAKEGNVPVTEHLNATFSETFNGISDEKKQAEAATKKTDTVVFYGKFDDEKSKETPTYKAISKKAAKAKVSEDILGIVYDRGIEAWNESVSVSQQQYAFARVNSYINQGKTYFNEDADLHENMDESNNTPYVKAFAEKGSKEQLGWKASNKHGKVKYFGKEFKSAAHRHAGIDLEEAKATPCGRCGTTHVPPSQGGTCPALKKKNEETNENFMDGKGPGKPGDAARHGLKGKSATELKSIRSSDTASPRKKQLAHFMLNMTKNESTLVDEAGLWDNIHAKRKRIKAGSGERMRKPGSEGAPTKQNFRDASESIEEGYDVNSKHYKALTDLDLNTKNRDMTTKHDGYGPLNPSDTKGSKAFWDEKAKMWNTTTEAAMNARCGNCAAFNQAPAIMKKMAEGLGPAGEKIQELSNLGFCELFEFKCAGNRTCNKWLVNGPITEEDTENGTRLIDKESKNSKTRKSIENVDRSEPREHGKQAQIIRKVIENHDNCGTPECCGQCDTAVVEKLGNVEKDPRKRLIGMDSLVKAYKKDTPGQSNDINESFNIAYAAGIGVTLTAADLGMRAQSSFAYHPSVIEEMEKRAAEEVEEEVRSADMKGVVVRTASGKTIIRKQKVNRKIIGTGNLTDGKPDDTI